ncbi:hypothetical protein R20943_07205 [Paraburkholderia aspalathi]|nr:hypothetical protein R20943_07205 [Paraburkholderia aspalathi]
MKRAELKGVAKTLDGPVLGAVAPGVPVAVETDAGWMPCIVGADGALKPIGDESLPTSEATYGYVVEYCAKRFAAILADWLDRAEREAVVERNRRQADPLVCHSHDFCDANMAMLDTLQNIGVVAETFESLPEEVCILWCAAWEEARQSGFYFDVAV